MTTEELPLDEPYGESVALGSAYWREAQGPVDTPFISDQRRQWADRAIAAGYIDPETLFLTERGHARWHLYQLARVARGPATRSG